jgi:hypothetical protein
VVAFARRVERGAMTIPAGTRLGAFEVSSLLGVGGMTEELNAKVPSGGR